MNETPKTVNKKIYCYDIRSSKDLNETFLKMKKAVNNNYKNLEERKLIYSDKVDGYKYFLDVRRIKKYRKYDDKGEITIINCILYKLRKDDFPYLFNLATGEKSEISSNNKDTLMEQTHFIVIPEIGLIISEFNYVGASVSSKLFHVIENVLGLDYVIDFEVVQKLDSQISSKISKIKAIKKFHVKAGHQGLKAIAKECKIGVLDTIEKTFSNYKDLEYEITIKGVGKLNSKKSKDIQIEDLENFKDMCTKLSQQKNRKLSDIKKVELLDPTNGTNIPLDIFEEYAVGNIEAIKLSNKSKYIDSDDMFQKLIDLYCSNKLNISNYVKIQRITRIHS